MANEKYIILRSEHLLPPVAADAGAFGRAGAYATGPQTLAVEEADLTKAEANDLRRDPRTRGIAESMPMRLIAPVAEADAEPSPSSTTWGVDAVGAPGSSFTGAGATVAVLDTGIDPDHPAFAGVELVRKNFTEGPDDDTNGHGTHCAGTIFGRNVGDQRIGVANGVNRALIGKVLGEGGGSSLSIAHAIQWAVREGAHVISMSLGIDFPGFVDFLVNQRGMNINPATSIALEEYRANVNVFSQLAEFVQINDSFAQGTVIVAASGNESERPAYEINVAPPAAASDIIAVGALQESPAGLAVASFSNQQVNVSGPGVDVVSAAIGGGLRSLSGTSMATPHAAGVAALWAQKQLDERGNVRSRALAAQLIASGTTDPLVDGFEPDDVGTGLIQAP